MSQILGPPQQGAAGAGKGAGSGLDSERGAGGWRVAVGQGQDWVSASGQVRRTGGPRSRGRAALPTTSCSPQGQDLFLEPRRPMAAQGPTASSYCACSLASQASRTLCSRRHFWNSWGTGAAGGPGLAGGAVHQSPAPTALWPRSDGQGHSRAVSAPLSPAPRCQVPLLPLSRLQTLRLLSWGGQKCHTQAGLSHRDVCFWPPLTPHMWPHHLVRAPCWPAEPTPPWLSGKLPPHPLSYCSAQACTWRLQEQLTKAGRVSLLKPTPSRGPRTRGTLSKLLSLLSEPHHCQPQGQGHTEVLKCHVSKGPSAQEEGLCLLLMLHPLRSLSASFLPCKHYGLLCQAYAGSLGQRRGWGAVHSCGSPRGASSRKRRGQALPLAFSLWKSLEGADHAPCPGSSPTLLKVQTLLPRPPSSSTASALWPWQTWTL